MDCLERIERWNALIHRIASMEKLLAIKKQRLANMRQDCPHEVVVRIDTRHELETNKHLKCILCGKETIDEDVFKNSEIIDVSNYKARNKYNAKAKFRIANAMFLRILERRPDLTEKEIAKIANERLLAENEKFKESEK